VKFTLNAVHGNNGDIYDGGEPGHPIFLPSSKKVLSEISIAYKARYFEDARLPLLRASICRRKLSLFNELMT